MDMEASARFIVQCLVDALNTTHQKPSSMPLSIYDTAWTSMVSKPHVLSRRWLFPQCFKTLLAAQGTDGGFGDPNSGVDAILDTAAALLAMCKHNGTSISGDDNLNSNVSVQIEKATAFLQRKLEEWDVQSTVHVESEALIPVFLDMLSDEGLQFDFPGSERLEKKTSNLAPPDLDSQHQRIILFVPSPEARAGYLDSVNKPSHRIQKGTTMASPASAAANLIYSPTWDDEAESYLRFVVEHEGGKVASAFPISIPEIALILSTLLDNGFSVESLGSEAVSQLADFLDGKLCNLSHIAGLDVDNMANVMLTMNLLNHPTSCAKMIEAFVDSSHFRAHVHESGPSFSANCNIIMALARSPELPSQHRFKIHEALRFLNQVWERGELSDELDLEQQHSIMLFAGAICDVIKLYDANESDQSFADPVLSSLAVTTLQICVRTISSQDDKGAWQNSCEASAYAILTLKKLASLPWIRDIIGDKINSGIASGEGFLHACRAQREILARRGIEKASNGSQLLLETHCLAALNASATYTWGGNVTALTQLSMIKVSKFSVFFSRLPLFSEEPLWRLRASVAEGYMMASTLDDSRARSVFPQAESGARSKYVEYIPLTWTVCNNAGDFGLSTQTMREMMIISLLNFQIDKYLEDVLVDRALRHDFQALYDVIRLIPPADPSEPSSTHQPNCDRLQSPITNGADRDGARMNGGLVNGEMKFPEDEAGSGGAHPELLSDFRKTVKRFVSYVQGHTAVSRSSPFSRRRMTARLLDFLHAHITQGKDNLDLVLRDTSYDQGVMLADAGTTFYDWLHSTSAIHTSCPYSFQFFQCLIAPAGQDCFEGALPTYISQDLCRHLASMCRIYNDYGSIVRDRTEHNLNSVNFPEFHSEPGCDGNGKNVELDMMDDKLRQKLMRVAAYERRGVDAALQSLKPEVHPETWRAVQVFVKVTDLYGQIYVVKDINDASGKH